MDKIDTSASYNCIVTVTTIDEIITRSRINRVITCTTVDAVTDCTTRQFIRSQAAAHLVTQQGSASHLITLVTTDHRGVQIIEIRCQCAHLAVSEVQLLY